MDLKGHMIDQKGLKMYEKSQKMEFSDLKYLLFSGIFLSGIGGYPPPPLNGKSAKLFQKFFFLKGPYLIIVIFFTLTQFLENKIYTQKTRKLRQNTQ